MHVLERVEGRWMKEEEGGMESATVLGKQVTALLL